MLESFLVALRVVAPMALMIGLGVIVRTARIIDRPSMRKMDTLSFRVFMPTLLFKNIYETDLTETFSLREVVFAMVCVTVIFVFALFVPPRLVRDRNQAASIGQAVIRANYLLFGVAVAESIYGEGSIGPVALMAATAIPATNALSAVLLELNRSGKANPGKIFLSILKNPMVVATLLALSLFALQIRIPSLIYGVIRDVAGVTTTLSFISLGISLDLGELRSNRFAMALGVVLRMVLVPLVFLPITVAMGFRGQSLCALMILFAAPTAVASYPMAVAMGADGPLAGQLVCVTTLVSILTMFCFTFLFKSLGML